MRAAASRSEGSVPRPRGPARGAPAARGGPGARGAGAWPRGRRRPPGRQVQALELGPRLLGLALRGLGTPAGSLRLALGLLDLRGRAGDALGSSIAPGPRAGGRRPRRRRRGRRSTRRGCPGPGRSGPPRARRPGGRAPRRGERAPARPMGWAPAAGRRPTCRRCASRPASAAGRRARRPARGVTTGRWPRMRRTRLGRKLEREVLEEQREVEALVELDRYEPQSSPNVSPAGSWRPATSTRPRASGGPRLQEPAPLLGASPFAPSSRPSNKEWPSASGAPCPKRARRARAHFEMAPWPSARTN